MVDATHSDPIELYGSRHTVIVGNHLHSNETGIMAPDGADHELIEDNVITTNTGGYPWPIVLGSDSGSTIRHNTMPDGACNWNIRCGTLRIYGGNSGTASRGTIVQDNVVGEISVEGGSALAADAHNLDVNGASRDATDVKGRPTFVGGSNPATLAGFALAAGSVG